MFAFSLILYSLQCSSENPYFRDKQTEALNFQWLAQDHIGSKWHIQPRSIGSKLHALKFFQLSIPICRASGSWKQLSENIPPHTGGKSSRGSIKWLSRFHFQLRGQDQTEDVWAEMVKISAVAHTACAGQSWGLRKNKSDDIRKPGYINGQQV